MKRFLTKLLVKFFSYIFKCFWGFVHFLQFLHPKKHPKIVIGLWKSCIIRQIYFHCLKYMLRFLTKLLFEVFCQICEDFWDNVQFLQCFRPNRHQKITTGSLNKCGILQTCLCSLEHIIGFLTKLRYKLCFEYF